MDTNRVTDDVVVDLDYESTDSNFTEFKESVWKVWGDKTLPSPENSILKEINFWKRSQSVIDDGFCVSDDTTIEDNDSLKCDYALHDTERIEAIQSELSTEGKAKLASIIALANSMGYQLPKYMSKDYMMYKSKKDEIRLELAEIKRKLKVFKKNKNRTDDEDNEYMFLKARQAVLKFDLLHTDNLTTEDNIV